MKKFTFLIAVFLGGINHTEAQEVTFSEDIAPIIYNNCTVCHRPGEIGPMALTSYEEVRNWGPMIQRVTATRYMPPWKPDKDYSRFQDERGLTAEEINLIKQWVDNGMPQGNLVDEPPLPYFPDRSAVGKPDLVLSFEEAYTHQGNNKDQYQIFVLPTGLTEDKVVKAIELRPGNRRIVHHALFALDESGQARQLDAATPEYGYSGFGGYGVRVTENYNGYVPGATPILYSEGIGQTMAAGSDLLIQMHYAPSPIDEIDSSSVNIFFADENEKVNRFVQQRIMLPFGRTIQNGPFVMRPETVNKFHCKWEVPSKVSLIAVAPHMHLLGKDWEVYSVSPQGDTTNLISVPDWDFNWQGSYFFRKFMVVEPGSEIHAFATYDNTSNNPLNPNFPPQTVTWGEGTADEMFYLPFFFVPYQNGDENVVFEQDDFTTSVDRGVALTYPEDELKAIFPNPVKNKLTVEFKLGQSGAYNIEILNINGEKMLQPANGQFFNAGEHQFVVPVNDLPSGTYLIQIRGTRTSLAQKFTVISN